MEELKRCPFCGGEATVMEAVGDVWVKCSECHSSNGVSTGARAKAIAAWNTRNEAADEIGRLRTALDVSMTTLEQIATTPRNKGAQRNAYATLEFLLTQLMTPNVEVTGAARLYRAASG